MTLAKLNNRCALSVMSSGETMKVINGMMSEQLALEGKLIKGRHILFEVYKHFRLPEAEGSILDIRDLIQAKLHNGQLVTFPGDWESVPGAMQMLPPDNIGGPFLDQQAHRPQPPRYHIATQKDSDPRCIAPEHIRKQGLGRLRRCRRRPLRRRGKWQEGCMSVLDVEAVLPERVILSARARPGRGRTNRSTIRKVKTSHLRQTEVRPGTQHERAFHIPGFWFRLRERGLQVRPPGKVQEGRSMRVQPSAALLQLAKGQFLKCV